MQSMLRRIRANVRMRYYRFIDHLEYEGERLLLYSPLFISIGIIGYFGCDHSSLSLVAVLTALVVLVCLIVGLFYHRVITYELAYVVVVILFCMVSGYFASFVRDISVSTTTLVEPSGEIWLEGTIEKLEFKEKVVRVYLLHLKYDAELEDREGKALLLDRVRINLRMNSEAEDLFVNDRIRVRAVLMPPPQQLLPNTFDFARFAYFKKIGAIGYAVTNPIVLSSDKSVCYSSIVNTMRQKISNVIRRNIDPEPASIINAILRCPLFHYINNQNPCKARYLRL